MTLRDASELRRLARRYRGMVNYGDDPVLKAELLKLADEFEQEAAKSEAKPTEDGPSCHP